ncbi:hypothetical protein BO86DRAFT_320242, partial [Aspergillus japonicus CBS 114.51]
RVWKTGLPVRSAVLKPHAGRLVVGWVTTSESLLLYVFVFLLFATRPYCERLVLWVTSTALASANTKPVKKENTHQKFKH